MKRSGTQASGNSPAAGLHDVIPLLKPRQLYFKDEVGGISERRGHPRQMVWPTPCPGGAVG